MIKYTGKIVQFGFGAVGKSFFEKVSKEISFYENRYIVITGNPNEFEAYINMGGIATNFYVYDVNRENYQEIFDQFLSEGDLLIDFADAVGTRDICKWCCEHNIMYLNTGEADWPENWYSIFTENLLKNEMKEKYHKDERYNRHPIVLQHGNNPGLVSHFVKAAIEYIIHKQFRKDKTLKKLLKEQKWNEIARYLGIRMIHVNDIDLQKIKEPFQENKLVSTWCPDSFFFELLSEATENLGTHEKIDDSDLYRMIDREKGVVEYKTIAADTKCKTYYPNGYFEGYLVPHEETITIANYLEVVEDGKVVYRPSVMFIYLPCDFATNYLKKAKVNDYPNTDMEKPQDGDYLGYSIVRGYLYPQNTEIAYQENIEEGTEYVGVLLLGEHFDPVWVGNRIEPSYLYKHKKGSYWQTPTITPVAMSALAAVCWMLKHKDRGGIFFPDDIPDYKYILKIAEKYISKTIYHTFDGDMIEKALKIQLSDIQSSHFFVTEKESQT